MAVEANSHSKGRQCLQEFGCEEGKRQASTPGIRSFAVFWLKMRGTGTWVSADWKEQVGRGRRYWVEVEENLRAKSLRRWKEKGLNTDGETPSPLSGDTEMRKHGLCPRDANGLGNRALQRA